MEIETRPTKVEESLWERILTSHQDLAKDQAKEAERRQQSYMRREAILAEETERLKV